MTYFAGDIKFDQAASLRRMVGKSNDVVSSTNAFASGAVIEEKKKS